MAEEGGLWELAIAAAAKVVAANGGAPPPPPPPREGTTYKGVRLPRRGKWSAEIRDSPTSLVWLGTYYSVVEAACAYDAAVRALRPGGARTRTNFPEPPETTEAEREARAAVVRAHVDEVKRRRAEKEARRDAEEAAAAAVATPPPAPAAEPDVAPAPGDESSSETELEEDATEVHGGASSEKKTADASWPPPPAQAPASDSLSTSAASPPAANAVVVSAPVVNFPSAFHVAVSTNAPQTQQSLAALRRLAQLHVHRNLDPSYCYQSPLGIITNPSQPSANFQPPLAATAATPAPFTHNPQAQPSAFQSYRSEEGSTRKEYFPTTGGCTMANIPPAQFKQLYRRFVGASGLGEGGGSEPAGTRTQD